MYYFDQKRWVLLARRLVFVRQLKERFLAEDRDVDELEVGGKE